MVSLQRLINLASLKGGLSGPQRFLRLARARRRVSDVGEGGGKGALHGPLF